MMAAVSRFQLYCAIPILYLAFVCARLSQAGSLEASGRLDEARERARSAKGSATFVLVGCVLLATMPYVPAPQRFAVPVLAASGASVALLAALSGKPRPSVWFATGLLAASVVAA